MFSVKEGQKMSEWCIGGRRTMYMLQVIEAVRQGY